MAGKPKVFVTRTIPKAGLDRIREHCAMDLWENELPPPRDVLLTRVQGVEGLLSLLTDTIDAEVIDAAGPQLKVISQYAVGYDNIDIAEAHKRGIVVGNTPGVLTNATADLAFTLMMAGARRLLEAANHVQAGKWKTWSPTLLRGHSVHGATLGIVGLGRIGQAVAKRAAGFEMRILAHDPHCSEETAAAVGASLISLEGLLQEADFVTLHTPLNEQTHHLIDADALDTMKPSAVLVNTSRGPVIDQSALVEALKTAKIAYAALDVTDPEPLPADDELLTLPNAIVVPHIGSATIEARDAMARIAAENLLAGLRGDPLPYTVRTK